MHVLPRRFRGALVGALLGLVPMIGQRVVDPLAFLLTNLVVLTVTTGVCTARAAGTLLVVRRAESSAGRLATPKESGELAE
jgi:hypothetical protein